MDAKTTLLTEIQAFRDWAGTLCEPISVEWEFYYDGWYSILKAFEKFIDSAEPETWDGSTIDFLLYIVARDNVGRDLQDVLIDRPRHLAVLAKAGQHSNESEARWQLVEAVGRADFGLATAERLIEPYVADPDEYVSRMALIALGNKKSPMAEAVALRAWETGHQDQRMAALSTLAAVGSRHLAHYLDLAAQDGREYLVLKASQMRANLIAGQAPD